MEIVFLGLILLVVAGMAFITFKNAQRIETILSSLDQNTTGLKDSLNAHKGVVEKMPQNFDNIIRIELENGLHKTVTSIGKLQQNLAQTHDAFQQLSNNIPHLTEMPEWLSDVKKTIEPLQVAAYGIQNLDDKIIERFNTFMAGRDQLEKTFGEISELIKEWTLRSETERTEFKTLVGEHLTNLSQQTKQLETAMIEIQRFSENNNHILQGLAGIPTVVNNMQAVANQLNLFSQNTKDNARQMSDLIKIWETRAEAEQKSNEQSQQRILYVLIGIAVLTLISIFLKR